MIEVSVKALRELGICLYDRHGEMKPLRELTKELEDAYYKINPEKKEPLPKLSRICLLCCHTDKDYRSSSEVEVCPKCNGAFVDKFKSGKYKQGVDCASSKDYTSLLYIELQDETAVPKVFYEGKEITGKVRVSFDWITKGCEPNSGGTKFNIEHHETGHGDIVTKGLGLRRGKYALDKQ